MTWRRAALLAIIPWVILVATIFAYHVWDGMQAYYGWQNYAWRMTQVAIVLYAGCTWALRSSRPYTPKVRTTP
jgi:hypothetical protein